MTIVLLFRYFTNKVPAQVNRSVTYTLLDAKSRFLPLILSFSQNRRYLILIRRLAFLKITV